MDSDQEYTEFLGEFGRYRCVGSGQGLICSGNAYTTRFDKIMQDFTNVLQYVDDSLIWADNVREMFDSFYCVQRVTYIATRKTYIFPG